jgi:hypothetical protein
MPCDLSEFAAGGIIVFFTALAGIDCVVVPTCAVGNTAALGAAATHAVVDVTPGTNEEDKDGVTAKAFTKICGARLDEVGTTPTAGGSAAVGTDRVACRKVVEVLIESGAGANGAAIDAVACTKAGPHVAFRLDIVILAGDGESAHAPRAPFATT